MKAGEKQRTRPKQPGGPLRDLPVAQIDVTCPSCGFAVGLWTGGDETLCTRCGYTIFKKPLIDH